MRPVKGSKTAGGQIVVGLAFSFMCFLALFSMVYQSSLLVREKIKLQQTTDYAALTGSTVQRIYLDQVHKLNTDIDKLFDAYQIELSPLPCQYLLHDWASGSLIAMQNISNPLTQKTAVDCQSVCNQFDEWYRDKLIKAYELMVKERQAYIQRILSETNAVAHDYAMEHFFVATNLPARLYHHLRKSFGTKPTRASLRENYQRDAFAGHLQVFSSGSASPSFQGTPKLFIPQAETRRFTYPTSISFTSTGGTVVDTTCSLPMPGTPKTKASLGKITRSKDHPYNTHFVTAAIYDPPTSAVEGRFKLYVKDLNTKQDLTQTGGQKIALLPTKESKDTRRWPLLALAMAKPFGGLYPQASQSFGLLAGHPGTPFAGVKLAGMADTAELNFPQPVFDRALLQESLQAYPSLAAMLQQLGWNRVLH